MMPTTVSQNTTLSTPQLPAAAWFTTELPCEVACDLTLPALGTATAFLRDQAITENLPMVRFLARQMHARLPQHIELEELIAAGTLGLVDAAARFDGGKQVQFKSYAQIRIRGAMVDSLREYDWSPRTLRRQGRDVEQAVRALAAKGVRSPTDGEIAAELGMKISTYQELLQNLKGLEIGSLNVERNEESGEQEIDYVAGAPSEDPLFRCLQGEMHEQLMAAIDSLPEKERLVLTLYYHEELTMREISQVLGVVGSRVSQMHSSAVLRLRAALVPGKPQNANRTDERKPSSSKREGSPFPKSQRAHAVRK